MNGDSKRKKLHLIITDIFNECCNTPPHTEQFDITRRNLRIIICRSLKITDAHIINGWINLLIGENFITPNSTSELSRIKKVLIPNNDSRYIINIQKITQELGFGSFRPTETFI